MISYDFNEYWLFNVSEGGTKQIEIQLLSDPTYFFLILIFVLLYWIYKLNKETKFLACLGFLGFSFFHF